MVYFFFLKEVFMNNNQPVTQLNHNSKKLAEQIVKKSSDRPSRLERFNICKSAAMFSLAISMGTSGMLLLSSQSQAVTAESISTKYMLADLTESQDSLQGQSTSIKTVESIAKDNTNTVDLGEAIVLHRVKAGDTIANIAQKYNVEPEAIALVNQIDVQTELTTEENLKIPLVKNRVVKEQNLPETSQTIYTAVSTELTENKVLKETETDTVAIDNENNISDKIQNFSLEEQQYNVKNLAEEKSESNNQSTNISTDKIARDESSELLLSQDLSSINNLSTETEREKIVEIPVPQPENIEESISTNVESVGLDKPVLITVPTPESNEIEPKNIAQLEDKTNNNEVIAKAESLNIDKQGVSYQVKAGDTLDSIARAFGLTRQQLMTANDITNPNLLKVDLILTIPSNRLAQKTETDNPLLISSLPSTSDSPNSKKTQLSLQLGDNELEYNPKDVVYTSNSPLGKVREDIVKLGKDYKDRIVNNPEDSNNSNSSDNPGETIGATSNDIEKYNSILKTPIGTEVQPTVPPLSSPEDYLPNSPDLFNGYAWPSKGIVTSGYGRRWGKMHKGIDIAAPIGTPIFASAAGEVVSAGWSSGGYGNLVKIKHIDGSITFYAHNSKILVRKGQQVQQGEQISEMGSTGFSTGPHLHFEIHPNGKGAVNPIAFLPKKSRS